MLSPFFCEDNVFLFFQTYNVIVLFYKTSKVHSVLGFKDQMPQRPFYPKCQVCLLSYEPKSHWGVRPSGSWLETQQEMEYLSAPPAPRLELLSLSVLQLLLASCGTTNWSFPSDLVQNMDTPKEAWCLNAFPDNVVLPRDSCTEQQWEGTAGEGCHITVMLHWRSTLNTTKQQKLMQLGVFWSRVHIPFIKHFPSHCEDTRGGHYYDTKRG